VIARHPDCYRTLSTVRRPGRKRSRSPPSSGTRIRWEIDRLVGALAVTDDKPDAVVNGIADRQARLRDLDAKISATKVAPQVVEDTLTRIVDASLDAIPYCPKSRSGLIHAAFRT